MPGRRIVLLEMSTEETEMFVTQVNVTGEVGCFLDLHEDEAPQFNAFTAEVVAVVARPTQWCTCDVPQESRAQRRRRVARRESSWHRGTTFGWWTCVNCNKPSRPVVTHWVTTMLAGANDLLPAILGRGTPLAPQDRWRNEGGGENPHVSADPAKGVSLAGPSRRSQRRKPTRSERDRQERGRG